MRGVEHVDEIHAWLVRDTDGTEGVPGVATSVGAVPLITASTGSGEVVAIFNRLAREAAAMLEPGQTMTHVVFRMRTDLEQL